MLPPGHRTEVLILYRLIIKAGKDFPDILGSSYIRWRARMLFRRYSREVSEIKVNEYLSNGRKSLRQITNANCGDSKCFERILQLAYCTKGRLYHVLWWRIENEHRALMGLTSNRMELIKYRYGRHFYLKAMGSFSDLPKDIEDWIQTCVAIYTEDWLKNAQIKATQPNIIKVQKNQTEALNSIPKAKYKLPPCVQLYLQNSIMEKERFYRRRFKSITDGFIPRQIADATSNKEIQEIVEQLIDSKIDPKQININKMNLPQNEPIFHSKSYNEKEEADSILNSEWMKEEMEKLLTIANDTVIVK